jgi:ribosome-interacting GTPase 1
MAINVNDPEYLKAEKEFHEADNIEDQLFALEKMISHAPAHKGAENLRQQLTTRRKKLEEQIERKKKVGKTTKVGIKKEDMQAVIIGKTLSGKSSLINNLANTRIKTGHTRFNTQKPEIAMMNYKTTQIQLIENPAIGSQYYDRGLPHTADTIIIVVDKIEDIEELINETNKHPGKKIIVVTKIDLLDENQKRKINATLQSKKYNFVLVSNYTLEGIEELKEKIFSSFDVLRIYTKEPGKEKSNKPMIMKPGAIVKDVAEKILKGFSQKIKETRIYGPSATIGLKHKLKDLDVVEFKTK